MIVTLTPDRDILHRLYEGPVTVLTIVEGHTIPKAAWQRFQDYVADVTARIRKVHPDAEVRVDLDFLRIPRFEIQGGPEGFEDEIAAIELEAYCDAIAAAQEE